ncbi:TVP38/TMEM64 family protein [Paenalkalicoccus suaedae]|uniref:TVP38/TMEM64 family membrane protein n=1 Tax=Paenalkalicoccus suaedae TaxID=2592382 RepID=A0A859FFV0_9BACI|nr:VTT domain-containing protein [Paenalkalicoccus suaedae]QKS72009.1 TVP38/TMEM64 family protein [Paenalkalicoccus suaedae]
MDIDMIQHQIAQVIEEAGVIAPILFVLLHLFRPILFLPVVLVCVAGGYFFGFLYGTLYSIIGLSLMSFVFYIIVNKFPTFREKIASLKQKVFKDREMSVGQVMILRMMPFVHFHLLSLYLMEMTKTFKGYMYYSVVGILLPAAIFTGFGHVLTDVPWEVSIVLIALALTAFGLLEWRKNRSPADKNQVDPQ